MLIDLGRNDLTCRDFGSVRVRTNGDRRYSHVMHIVSHIVARLREARTPSTRFAQRFRGTVSGAPKIRAMQIIADLEKADAGFTRDCWLLRL